jgi:hypothetical protein
VPAGRDALRRAGRDPGHPEEYGEALGWRSSCPTTSWTLTASSETLAWSPARHA